MHKEQLLSALDSLLSPNLMKDYCPNGLQVEGKDVIFHLVTGVTASQKLIDKAIAVGADAVLVHHGFFWKNEDYRIVGMKKRRIAALLKHDINLYAYHLPLDVHETYGNNAQLGKVFGLKNIQPLPQMQPNGIVMTGELEMCMNHDDFAKHISMCVNRQCIQVASKQDIKKVAWCTGGGQSFIDEVAQQARELEIDAFISGEISEQTTHSARELNIDYFAVGHHATERYGVKALGEHLAERFQLKVTFIDVDNPA